MSDTLLHFWPKDLTPCCVRERQAYRAKLRYLEAHHIELVQVTHDDAGAYERFAKDYGISASLHADRAHKLAAKYGATRARTFHGKPYVSVVNLAVLLDSNGREVLRLAPFSVEFDAVRLTQLRESAAHQAQA